MSLYEIIGFVTSVLCVWLFARENAGGFPVAAVASAFYCVVNYQAKLYSDAGLQIIYLFLSLYGWYQWRHGGQDQGVLRAGRLPRSSVPFLVLIGISFAAPLGYLLRTHTDASLPYLDAATTATSLIAQWMLARKYLENWLVWIAVDPIYAGMYVYRDLYLTAVLYLLLTLLAVQGYRQWRRAATVPA
ncbi:MAG: nicotinamide mononucleotide transporter [Ferruginibacter sp.]|nr:nicotinamide mononucleotide transporter [Cytophagales bacterium]